MPSRSVVGRSPRQASGQPGRPGTQRRPVRSHPARAFVPKEIKQIANGVTPMHHCLWLDVRATGAVVVQKLAQANSNAGGAQDRRPPACRAVHRLCCSPTGQHRYQAGRPCQCTVTSSGSIFSLALCSNIMVILRVLLQGVDVVDIDDTPIHGPSRQVLSASTHWVSTKRRTGRPPAGPGLGSSQTPTPASTKA